ncbi:MAG: NUDIX hydrolase [Candidatus Micrarchaeota archaeon]|nr:NUDIX hydrolase [Candidatus Micrarchaeota archaeon]
MPKRILFRWGTHTVEEEDVRVKGKKTTVRRVTSNDSVCILPLIGKNGVIIVRQYRKGVNRYVYELPAGQIEKGEKPAHAARRELEEEIGYRAGKLKFLFTSYINPSLDTETTYHFLATDLVKTKQGLEESKEITFKTVKMPQLIKMVKGQKIKDNDSLVGILRYFVITMDKVR